jgi:hypothetical protein
MKIFRKLVGTPPEGRVRGGEVVLETEMEGETYRPLLKRLLCKVVM